MVKFDIGTKFAYHNKVYEVVRHIAGPTEYGERTTIHHCVNINDDNDKEQVNGSVVAEGAELYQRLISTSPLFNASANANPPLPSSAATAAAMNSNTTAASSGNVEQITKKAKTDNMKVSATTTNNNNNNNSNIMDMDIAEKGTDNSDGKLPRVSKSPSSNNKLSDVQMSEVGEDATTSETLNMLLRALNKDIPDMVSNALIAVGGNLTESVELKISEKKKVNVSDASKLAKALAERINTSTLVANLSNRDLSGPVESKYGNEPTINPKPQIAALSSDKKYGKMGDFNPGSIATRNLDGVDALVNDLQNLGIKNRSEEQQCAIAVEYIRTIICQWQKRQRREEGETGKISTGKSLPSDIVSKVARQLNPFITSIDDEDMEGIVRDISIIFLSKSVEVAKGSTNFNSLVVGLRNALDEFWNGYSSTDSPLYKKGEKNAVDDSLCYKRLENDIPKEWAEFVKKLEEEEETWEMKKDKDDESSSEEEDENYDDSHEDESDDE